MDDSSSVDSSIAGSAASRRGAPDRPVGALPKAYADLFRARYIEFDNKMKKDPS